MRAETWGKSNLYLPVNKPTPLLWQKLVASDGIAVDASFRQAVYFIGKWYIIGCTFEEAVRCDTAETDFAYCFFHNGKPTLSGGGTAFTAIEPLLEEKPDPKWEKELAELRAAINL